MSKESTELHVIEWRGRDVGIRYQYDFMGVADVSDFVPCSLQVWHLQGQPLPISECGAMTYHRSAGEIEGIGGPVAYAEMWLNYYGDKPAWKTAEEARRQYSFGF